MYDIVWWFYTTSGEIHQVHFGVENFAPFLTELCGHGHHAWKTRMSSNRRYLKLVMKLHGSEKHVSAIIFGEHV